MEVVMLEAAVEAAVEVIVGVPEVAPDPLAFGGGGALVTTEFESPNEEVFAEEVFRGREIFISLVSFPSFCLTHCPISIRNEAGTSLVIFS